MVITPSDFGMSSEALSTSDSLDIPPSQMYWLSAPMGQCWLLMVLGQSISGMWHTETERVRFDLTGSLNFVFSPDSQKIVVANDFHTVQVWDIAGKKLLSTLQGEDGAGRGIAAKLAISPYGKHLASTEASTAIHLWNLETLRRRSLLRGHLFKIVSLAFSPDGQILASGDSKGNVIVWDIETKKQITTFQSSRPWSMTFSPDGQYLLLETSRRLAKITQGAVIAVRWQDGREVDRLTFKNPGFASVALSKDGKRLITSGEQILLWDVNLPSLAIEPIDKQLTLWGDVKQTALLQNYPNPFNPFNPETWIPYQLASDSVVTLTIYNVNGERIRQLDLGEKPAGIYQTQADAIHWDGRTDKGEATPSGIYFYTLDAAEHTHSRKMILLK